MTKRDVRLALVMLLGVAVRVPFWTEALKTPLDGDTAVLGLMARHPLRGTTMWGQPYGSPVEAWVAAPLLAAFGSRAESVRLAHFLLGLALIPLAYHIAKRLHPAAALPTALVIACPPPYLLLLASMPPPLYPTALALCAVAILTALRASEAPARRGTLLVWGLASGLGLWTHLMCAAVVGPCLVFLLRRRRWRDVALWGILPLLAASAPWWNRVLAQQRATEIVSVSGKRAGFLDHFTAVAPRLAEPVFGLLGTEAPVVADDPEHVVHAPRVVSALIVLAYGFALVFAVRAGALKGAPGMLLAMVVVAVVAFPFPQRSHPTSIRFLTPLYLPLVAVLLWAAASRRGARRAWVVALTLACLHLAGSARLLRAWRGWDRRAPPFLLVDLGPVRRRLDAQGIRRVYASYGPAYRLTFDTGERIVASQPWNERFLHWPLPYLDEVRFAHDVAWVITPTVPSDLPAPDAFESALGAAGGAWRRDVAGEAVVFDAFVPPFGPEAEPLPGAGAAGDRDPRTVVTPAASTPTVWTLDRAEPLDGITLVAPPLGLALPRSMDVDVSVDGRTWTTVARRRRRGEREDLRWVNGHPQYVIDNDLLAVPLGGRMVRAIRVTPVASGDSWALGELLVHRQARGAQRVWEEWLDPALDWGGRLDALTLRPRPEREDWYYRMLLAERHR